MNDNFFYELGGKQFGPVCLEDLKQVAVRGELRRTDKIWAKGMETWQASNSIPGLFEGLAPDLEPEAASPSVGRLEQKAAVSSSFEPLVSAASPELELFTPCADKSFVPPPKAPLSKNENLTTMMLLPLVAGASVLIGIVIYACVSNPPKQSFRENESQTFQRSDAAQQAQWDANIRRNEEIWRRDDDRKAQGIDQARAMLRAQGIPDSPGLTVMASNAWYQAHYDHATLLLQAVRSDEAKEEIRSIQPYHVAP